MGIVNEGDLRLTAVKSSFVACAPVEGQPGGFTKG